MSGKEWYLGMDVCSFHTLFLTLPVVTVCCVCLTQMCDSGAVSRWSAIVQPVSAAGVLQWGEGRL